MLRWALLALAGCTAMPADACDTGPYRIYYHSGSARLSDGDKRVLDYMNMAAQEEGFIRLSGHADTAGSAEENLRLSKRRVETARDFLISLGLPSERIITESFGESHASTAIDDNSPSWRHRYVLVELLKASEARKGKVGRASATCGG